MLQPQKAQQFLAELQQIGSSRAAISPRMTALAKLFDRLVKSITNDELIAFRNFYARFRYLLATLPLRDVEHRNLENFRRLMKDGDTSRASEKALEQGLLLLKNLLALSTGNPAAKEPAFREGYFTRLYPKRDYARLTDLKLLCYTWTDITLPDGKASLELKAFDLEDLREQLTIHIRQNEYYDHTVIRQWLKENAVLYIQHMRSLGPETYETTFDTLITLEPDFLVDATDIGECFTSYGANSELFFLNRLVSDLPGAAAVKGSIVGYYLDELMRDPTQDKETIYRSAQKLFAMRVAQLGRTAMQDIRRSVYTEHLPNIETLVKREGKKDIWIEPTYFSTQYGLQGRLDLLCKSGDTQDIIELKSGSSPAPNPGRLAFPNHQMQVICYDMMLESTYGQHRKGFNAVFYSKCRISPYRNLVSEHREKNQVLEIRNNIVARIYALASGDFSVMEQIKTRGVAGLPIFKEAALAQFRNAYEPERIATAYYQQMIAFLLREFVNTKVGNQLREDADDQPNGFAGLWLDPITEKLEDFRLIYDLETVEIKEGQGYVRLRLTRPIDNAFRKGDLVVLYPRTAEGYVALKHHILKGSLDEIHPDGLVVCLNNKQTNYTFIHDHQLWAVEPDIFERNYWSAISCLFNVLTAGLRKKRLLFGHEEPVFQQQQPYINPDLTAIQQKAVQQALDARDYYLLQGPPGTGKTSTFLISYIREAHRRTKKPIVVLAFTNRAVDKICQAFRSPRHGQPIPYLRIGNRYVQDEYTFDRQITGDDPDQWRSAIDKHTVFVSTVTTFHNNWQLLRQFIPFTEVVVDEASQLSEAVLSSILALFDKFILIGDHKQLPAVITQDDRLCQISNAYLNKLGISDLRKSLFERLLDNAIHKQWTTAYDQLRDHYRMHQDIAALITRHYRAALRTALPEQQQQDLDYPPLPAGHFLYPFSRHRVLFIETPMEGGPKRNEKEAEIVARIVHALVAEGAAAPKDIGIITPFRAQIAAIKENLQAPLKGNEDLIIDTVERYQGDERKIILFSTAIGDPAQVRTIQSLSKDTVAETDRKLLVSLSRAKGQFILLGNAEALSAAGDYRQLIEHIKNNGGYIAAGSLK